MRYPKAENNRMQKSNAENDAAIECPRKAPRTALGTKK
jgi:hypothetical protein